MLFFWGAWFVSGVILALVLAGSIIPYLWMRAYAALHPPRDRGIEKQELEDGCSVLYETAAPVSSLMCRYVLLRKNGPERTKFIGEWTQPFAAAQYRLIAYEESGAPCAVLNIREPGNAFRRFTLPAELPEETVCVSVVSCRTQSGRACRSERTLRFWLWACLFCLAASFAAGLVIGCSMRFAEAVAFEALGYTAVLPIGGAVGGVVACMAGIPLLAAAFDLFARPYAARALTWLRGWAGFGRLQQFYHKVCMRVRRMRRRAGYLLRARFCALQNMLAGGKTSEQAREDDENGRGGERT